MRPGLARDRGRSRRMYSSAGEWGGRFLTARQCTLDRSTEPARIEGCRSQRASCSTENRIWDWSCAKRGGATRDPGWSAWSAWGLGAGGLLTRKARGVRRQRDEARQGLATAAADPHASTPLPLCAKRARGVRMCPRSEARRRTWVHARRRYGLNACHGLPGEHHVSAKS